MRKIRRTIIIGELVTAGVITFLLYAFIALLFWTPYVMEWTLSARIIGSILAIGIFYYAYERIEEAINDLKAGEDYFNNLDNEHGYKGKHQEN